MRSTILASASSRAVAALLVCAGLAGCGSDGGAGSVALEDCGKATASSSGGAFGGCFDQHFAACTPARLTVASNGRPPAGVVVRYEIQGAGGGGCQVRWRYVTLPANPKWENADVVCTYPSGSDFQAALNARADFNGCSGPLVKLAGGGGAAGGGASSSGGGSSSSGGGSSSSGGGSSSSGGGSSSSGGGSSSSGTINIP